jgi:hypothetical protein
MDGRKWHIFLIKNFRQDTVDRLWIIWHNFTHKQNLCAKFPEMTEVFTVVSETVNCIRATGIHNHQFVNFLNDMESVYGEIHYCMEDQWLYCGGMTCKSENYFWNCMGNLFFSFAVATGCETLHFALTT